MITPETAYYPSPADGAKLASDANDVFSWAAGFGATQHSVYFGDDPNTVADANGAVPIPDTTFDPGALEAGKTYYWRVDEENSTGTVTGQVWSFSLAKPEPEPEPEPVPEPNLMDVAVLLNTEGDLAGTIDTFIAAVLATGLANHPDALGTEYDLTVFVPTDDAFAALDLTPENIGQLNLEGLTDLLLYLATEGRLLAADVMAVEYMEMLNGGNIDRKSVV